VLLLKGKIEMLQKTMELKRQLQVAGKEERKSVKAAKGEPMLVYKDAEDEDEDMHGEEDEEDNDEDFDEDEEIKEVDIKAKRQKRTA
jgi:hypothetical protein